VPGTLFESEFFGHVKGSFTGAIKDRVGRFELADRGTLFLDEVGEIPLELQAKLLRAIQEGEIERVGEERTRRLDVRIVAATNRDLLHEVDEGRFRRDLYFRLSVFPIAIPPLRERGRDAILLARHFLAEHKSHARPFELSKDDEALLLAYDWPGNVRELEHVLERAVILSRTRSEARSGLLRLDLALPSRAAPRAAETTEILREEDLRNIERENLRTALDRAGGRVSGAGGAAELLGMNPSTLRDRLKALKITRA
jgi:transcriptional regulator with GAF, ATPase, and Fis domain